MFFLAVETGELMPQPSRLCFGVALPAAD